MAERSVPSWIIDRLRENLRAEGIPLDPRDLERIVETGMLRTALAFAALEE